MQKYENTLTFQIYRDIFFSACVVKKEMIRNCTSIREFVFQKSYSIINV